MVFIDPPSAERFLAPARHTSPRSAARGAAARRVAAFAGPTFIASVAYLDPGNFATNITAGAMQRYQLLWVVVVANAMAMLFQALSAKLGIVTGRSLPRVCREHLPPSLTCILWVVSEAGGMATDLAELLGASLGCALLVGTSLLAGAVIAGALSWAVLAVHEQRCRAVEALIAALIIIVGVCFVVEMGLISPDWHAALYHSAIPSFGGPNGVVLAAGIVGATVMPHAVFLHSSVARNRLPAEGAPALRRLVRASNIDIGLTLGAVGLVNMAILCVSAATFGKAGAPIAHSAVEPSIEDAYRMLGPLFGGMSAAIFMTSLLASGLSSSVVGTMAGQVIMQDFVDWRIPLWVRRAATMLPTIVVAACVTDVTRVLVVSQVILSFVLPVPLVTLVLFTGKRSVMGKLTNSRLVSAVAIGATALVLGINALLLIQLPSG